MHIFAHGPCINNVLLYFGEFHTHIIHLLLPYFCSVNSLISPTMCSPPNAMSVFRFAFVFVLRTRYVQLLLSIYAWVWNHPVNYEKTTSGHNLKPRFFFAGRCLLS